MQRIEKRKVDFSRSSVYDNLIQRAGVKTMSGSITLEELQGEYDITYASSPPLEHFYEPGIGSARIQGNELVGIDALGVIWHATFEIVEENRLSFKATLDPKNTAETVGLMDKSGIMSRQPQYYEGVIKVSKSNTETILRTQVQQGPITINVQFRKKA